MVLVGSRSTTLGAQVVERTWGSLYNDDKKKLIAFWDSVQDAAHRAGFISARTYTHTVRKAIAKGVEHLVAGSLPWSQFRQSRAALAGADPNNPLSLTPEQLVAEFIGPNMTWQRAWTDLFNEDDPSEEQSADPAGAETVGLAGLRGVYLCGQPRPRSGAPGHRDPRAGDHRHRHRGDGTPGRPEEQIWGRSDASTSVLVALGSGDLPAAARRHNRPRNEKLRHRRGYLQADPHRRPARLDARDGTLHLASRLPDFDNRKGFDRLVVARQEHGTSSGSKPLSVTIPPAPGRSPGPLRGRLAGLENVGVVTSWRQGGQKSVGLNADGLRLFTVLGFAERLTGRKS